MNIVLCPGHHDQSKGAVNQAHDLNEYDEAVRIVALAEEILEQAGHTVIVVTGKLRQKIDRINDLCDSQRVDMALDVHFNADAETDDLDNQRGDGCMVMCLPRSDLRMHQANIISSRMSNHLTEDDLGGREGWYWSGSEPGSVVDAFLRKTKCPAFIPEPGYIDNSGFVDRCLLGDQWKRVAGAIATGVIAYAEHYGNA